MKMMRDEGKNRGEEKREVAKILHFDDVYY